MVANKNCKYRNRKEACFDHCQNWVTDNYTSLSNQIKNDRSYFQKYNNHFDLNIEIVILVGIFVLLSFVIYIIFNLRN